jgi:thiol-disulfide isomerase/thioredoxin
MAALEEVRLAHEGNLASFDGATGWLNSEPLAPADLRGSVVLVDFWTFTCVNWIRTAPYLRAWHERYREHGLTVIGVHTPEFPFEGDVDSIRTAIEEMRIAYPVAVDSDYRVWSAFANRYWPALYLADRDGEIRYHHFGEERYRETEAAIQALLGVPAQDAVEAEVGGIELAADWDTLRSPETYLGYEQGERFTSPGPPSVDEPHAYQLPSRLRLNDWALDGDWTIGAKATRSDGARGRLAYRFSARDVNLVMGPAPGRGPIGFEVRVDGEPPGAAAGVDVDAGGQGTAADRRLYQLVRQPGRAGERLFEITFLEPGAEVYVFTFG